MAFARERIHRTKRRAREEAVTVIGYMNIDEQVEADFARARRKATLRRLATRLRRNPTSGQLPCFEETRRKPGAVGGQQGGRGGPASHGNG